MIEQMMDFLDKFAPILYIIVPAIAGIYFKVKEKVNKQKSLVLKQSLEKRKSIYENWIHNESRETIKKLRDLCNLYKDKTHVDLVHYLQLENGTIATSKLHNMFVTCLAEDSRFGRLPKIISYSQRIPYNEFVDYLGTIDHLDNANYIGVCADAKVDVPNKPFLHKEVKSYLYINIKDMYDTIIGVAVFMYADPAFNGQSLDNQKSYLRQFQAGIEGVFFDFQMNRERKQRDLNLEESDVK